jgi:hypothetical protein
MFCTNPPEIIEMAKARPANFGNIIVLLFKLFAQLTREGQIA